MVATRVIRFPLGRTLATPGAVRALAEANITPTALIARHAAGDWGDLDAEDAALNDQAVRTGDRIVSAYRLPGGGKVWVITEGTDDDGNRAATTVLLPDEY